MRCRVRCCQAGTRAFGLNRPNIGAKSQRAICKIVVYAIRDRYFACCFDPGVERCRIPRRACGPPYPSQAPRLRIQRTFSVAPDNTFRAWTDAESIKRWFSYQVKVYWSTAPTVDANVGGHFNWSVVSKDGEQEVFHFHGTYREYRVPRKLSFSGNGNH